MLGRESGTIYPAGLSSGGTIIGYDKVTEVIGENGEGGKTEYFYNNYEDYSGAPFTPASHNPLNGKLKTSIVFNAAGDTLKRTDNIHLAKEIYFSQGFKLYRIDQFAPPSPTPVNEPFYNIRYYTQQSSWFPLQSETITEYNGTSKLVTTTTYNYENFDNKAVTLRETIASDRKIFTTKFKYPGDYTTAGTGSFAYQMKQQHIISPLVEQLTFVTDAGAKKLASGVFTEYKLYNNVYQPGTVFKINATVPLSDITESSITADNQIHLHPNYKPDAYFDRYNSIGNIEQYHKADNTPYTYIWNYQNTLPVARVDNAAFADIAYTSFEGDGTGNWTVSSSSRDISTAVTGKQSFNMSNAGAGGLSKTGLRTAAKYTVSYWTKNATPFTIAGTQGVPAKGRTINGWTYYQHVITGQATISLNGSGLIDELRLYPVDAQMATYTYEPLVGSSSECDVRNEITYFEYDGLSRLKLVKDMDGKILKQYEYQYRTINN